MLPLICDRCHGAAQVGGVRCRACAGGGAAVAWGDHMLTWSHAIDRASARGRVIMRAVRAITALLLSAVGVVALMGGAIGSSQHVILADGTVGHIDAYPWYFWVGILVACAAVTLAARQRDRDRPVPLVAAADPDAPLTAVASWEMITSARRIDVAARLSPEARSALDSAGALATRLRHATVEPVHLFVAAVSTRTGSELLARLGVDVQGLKERLEHALGRLPQFAQAVTLAPAAFHVLFAAYVDAVRARRPALGALRILASCAAHDSTIDAILEDLAVTPAMLANAALWIHVREEVRARHRRHIRRASLRPRHGMNRAMTAIATPILDAFGEDLTQLAAIGYLHPFVGREREFRELFRIIESGRRGVVLVGAHGVGKTAMIEALASRMASADVPALLRDRRLVRLSVARLTSGVSHAVAQERLLAATHEAARSGNILLVAEQIEHLLGAAAGDVGAMNLGDVLESILQQSGMVMIGTTSPEAYRAYVESSSLGALLERVVIDEPAVDEAIPIIAARSILVEAQQHVFFSYGAVEACVTLSHRYLHDHAMPEKAAVLMEEAATMVRTERGEGSIVTREDVARIVEEKTGIKETAVAQDEAATLLHLEEALHEKIIGQDVAVRAVAAAIRRARVGLREGKRPIATLLFLGSTGVGKTALAKAVAATYFGAETAMVRLDMSEFQAAENIARLIGEGVGGGGQLTEAVRRAPFSLVLLDEFEKAHADIRNVFLQVFDDGRLTDSAGRTVDFTQTMVIATSNVGTAFIQDAMAAGRPISDITRELMEGELRTAYRPELLNRFDGIIVFTPLTRADVYAIAQILIAEIAAELEVKGIHLRATDAALHELAEAGYDPKYGARPLRRVMQERVQDRLAAFLLEQKIGRRDTVVLDAGGTLTVEKAEEL